ncbi:MAG: TetR/AcrR family transcriptional regulator [Actinomycetota bacterium]|nr:TetR/AcrR family transcriptional regulator [Actinomycetota bacterium]
MAQGYHGAAMDDIAVRAGVSKPVLYQHFPGKLELYLALLDSAAAAVVDDVRATLSSTLGNKERAAATIDAYFRFFDEGGAAFRLVFESDLTAEAAVQERLEQVTRQCAEAVSSILADETGLPTEEALLLGAGLVGMAQVAARYWLRSAGSIPREEAVRLLATLSWRGVRGFPRAGPAELEGAGEVRG